tara:strand:- start:114 stop:290 length:177 start_codon:yes stop_codon:yes gene_type:complete
MRMPSPREESKVSPDDTTPQSGISSGMEFDMDSSSKRSNKRISPMVKMSAYHVMEGKT